MKNVFMTPLLATIAASVLSGQEPARKPDHTLAGPETHMRGATRCKASQLIGCPITNTKNENLGEIQDIVLDSGNRRIAYAVVAFGGVLGMGEKYFAMPWRLIEVGQRGADDAPRATLGLDAETLKAAPGFDKSKWPDMANPTWAKQVDDYYRSRNEGARPDATVEPKGSGADGKSGIDRGLAIKAVAHRRLSKMIGTDVVDSQHLELADVEDLIVDTKVASVEGTLLGFGSTLGMGERLALVPFEALSFDPQKHVYVFPCSAEQLEAMALPGGKLPALNDDAWLTRGREQCAKAREVGAANGDVIPVNASAKPVPFSDAYDLKKVETVKGTVTTMGSVRVGDPKEERVRIRVRTVDGREVIVYAAPAGCESQDALGLRAGKSVEVTGTQVKHGTQTVLVAGTIVVDGKTAKLRDDKGHATWTKK